MKVLVAEIVLRMKVICASRSVLLFVAYRVVNGNVGCSLRGLCVAKWVLGM